MRVLVVDDEQDLRVLMAHSLRILGHEPLLAGSAAEAYAICATTSPEVLLLDLSMPDGNGVELLEQLRHDRIEPATTVLVSAQMPERLAATAASLQVHHLTKPYALEALAAVLGQPTVAA